MLDVLTSLLECPLLLFVIWRVGGSIQTLIMSTWVLASGRYQRDGFDPLVSVPPKVRYERTCLLFNKGRARSCKHRSSHVLHCTRCSSPALLCCCAIIWLRVQTDTCSVHNWGSVEWVLSSKWKYSSLLHDRAQTAFTSVKCQWY